MPLTWAAAIEVPVESSIAAAGRQRDDVDAGRGDGDMAAAIGHLEDVVVAVGCGHGDHVRIGGRIERLGLRTGIAGRGDQHDAFAIGRGHEPAQRRIGRAGKAHIDDARTVVGRPLQAFVDRERRSLWRYRRCRRKRAPPISARRARCREACRARRWRRPFRCHANAASRCRRAHRSSFVTVPPRSGCLASISESITATRTSLPVAISMRFVDLQFAQHILRRIAPRHGGGCVLQREIVVRLHAGDDVLAARRIDHACDRSVAADAPAVQAGADQRKVLRLGLGQVVAARELIDGLRRRVRRKGDDDFIGNVRLIGLRDRRRTASVVVAVIVVIAAAGIAMAFAARGTAATGNDAAANRAATNDRAARRTAPARPARIAAAEARRRQGTP